MFEILIKVWTNWFDSYNAQSTNYDYNYKLLTAFFIKNMNKEKQCNASIDH